MNATPPEELGDGIRVRRVDRSTTTFSALLFFMIIVTVYAVGIFQQFSVWDITKVALAFVSIVLLLCAIFMRRELMSLRLTLSPLSIGLGLFISLPLAALLFTWLLETNPDWTPYYSVFPMIRLADGDGFHQDAVFHVSLIQSILSFGYPSTGQDGAPFVPYHVLSHYADAMILFITGLEPYDSYGLFFHFKLAIFIAVSVIFIWSASRHLHVKWYIGTLIVVLPILISTWIAVGSHSMWLTSLVLLLSARFVYRSVQAEKLSWRGYTAVFFVGVAIGLGKVSSGLMFAVLIGSLLALRDFRKPSPYILIAAWLAFFGLYYRVFDTGHSSGLQRPTFTGSRRFLNFSTTYGDGPVEWNLAAIYLLIFLSGIVGFIYANRFALRLGFSTAAGVLALTIVTQSLVGLTQPDIFYFIFGLTSIVIPLTLQAILDAIQGQPRRPEFLKRKPPLLARCAIVLLAVLITVPMFKAPINLFSWTAWVDVFYAAQHGYLTQYNSGLPPASHVTASEVAFAGEQLSFAGRDDPLIARDALDVYLRSNSLNAQNTLLFVPKEVFDTEISRYGGPVWAQGMLIYSLTGIPLIQGIRDTQILNFGQSSYGPDAGQQTRSFDLSQTCESGKQVVVVNSWTRGAFSLGCPRSARE